MTSGVPDDPGAPGAPDLPGAHLGAAFARALPELAVPWRARPVEQPSILALNESLAAELGLDPEHLRTEQGIRFLLGAELPEGAQPVAQAYAGHQFGMYNPRLGDGRALLLGEISNVAPDADTDVGSGGPQADAEPTRLRDIHLKGSGPTPFSRGDGFAAVGPMLREYLMGEAMHALGIPTTRALAVVATGRPLMRDDALDPQPGAVLVRVASSHLRVGTFQYARALEATGENGGLLRRLADFAIARHYPEAADAEHPYLALLEAVVAAQARLVSSWMLVGFVHGVMNTDNMTISGETIDYGPCAFIDAYDPGAVFSSIDRGGRYAYARQPSIALWNLTRLAEAILPLLGDDRGEEQGERHGEHRGEAPAAAEAEVEAARDAAVAVPNGFAEHYNEAWTAGMARKLGIATRLAEASGGGSGAAVDRVSRLAAALQQELHAAGADYTGAFRALAEAARGRPEAYRELLDPGVEPGEWFAEWLALDPDGDAMDAANPVVIPRNHLVDEALDAATAGDLAPFERLLDAVTHPFDRRPGFERYERPAPPGGPPHVTYCGT